MGVRRQRRRQSLLLRLRRGCRLSRLDGAGRAGDGCGGKEFPAIELRARILGGHLRLPLLLSLARKPRRPPQQVHSKYHLGRCRHSGHCCRHRWFLIADALLVVVRKVPRRRGRNRGLRLSANDGASRNGGQWTLPMSANPARSASPATAASRENTGVPRAPLSFELGLGYPPPMAGRIDLDEALSSGWIEFWYQPKIDLRKRQLIGAEADARAIHPQYGMLMPDAFIPGASESSLLKLSELALVSSLEAGVSFAKLGANLRMAVNMPAGVLLTLPVGDIVKSYQPKFEKWPGLVIDVAAEQILSDLALATEF